MPTAEMPLTFSPDGKPSQIWWRFWFALRNRTLQTVQATVNDAVTAAGTTQGTATALESEWNVITAGAINTGVVLDGFNIGVSTTAFNASGSAKNVYPPSGMTIDALGTNNPYSLANLKQQTFNQVSDTQFYSTQLG
jgi:TRAP-type mannitol/chloroaromatic compound transport system permease large subunit